GRMPSFGLAGARVADACPDLAAGEEHAATANPSAAKTAMARVELVMTGNVITKSASPTRDEMFPVSEEGHSASPCANWKRSQQTSAGNLPELQPFSAHFGCQKSVA